MKFFLFRWWACYWKSFVLASPSFSQLILERSRAMVRLREANARQCFFRLLFNHISPAASTRASCAISSWWRISLARTSWEFICPIFLSLQLCNPLETSLNLQSREMNGHGPAGTEFLLKLPPGTPQASAKRLQNEIFGDQPCCPTDQAREGSDLSHWKPYSAISN